LVAIDLFSLSIVHGLCNGLLLQLLECIESMKNDVKRKMVLHVRSNHALKSPRVTSQQKFFEHHFITPIPDADECKRSRNPAFRDARSIRSDGKLRTHLRRMPIFKPFIASHIYN
jgi:hypothetical protein